ncbi:MAG TPA: hypothetical protein VHC98_03605 [Candidatus Saccharimonadales bacterium]|nr:hypothetical protein [Candidatus Saccharimonadales bacterium]
MYTDVRRRVVGGAGRALGRGGFTIVETMIVLAVTGALFVAIAATLSGRQNAAEFTHAIQSIQSQLQQTVDQVSQGFYPNSSNFTCTASGSTLQIAAGTNGQGTNNGCVFLGKVVQLGVHGSDPEQYQVYTIAGLQSAMAGATSPFQTAYPTVVGVSGDYDTYATVGTLEYGLTTAWMKSNGNTIGAFGVLMEPGASGSGATGYGNAIQQVDLIPIRASALDQTPAQAATAINNALRDTTLTTDAPINPSGGVQICFASAGTNQSGLITIGGSGRQLVVSLSIKGNQTCS